MDGASIAAWVGVGLMTIFSIGSSIYTLVKSDRQRVKANGRLEENLENLGEASEKCSKGIEQVSKDIGNMKEHCASMTATFSTQITNLQREANSQKKEISS